MKSGKYINLSVNDKFKCGYGTVDSKNLKSIYVKLSSWLVPQSEQSNWNTTIGGLKRDMSYKLREFLSGTETFKTDRYIVDLDIRASGLEVNKKSFMNCEITLFVNSQKDIKDEIFKLEIHNLTKYVIDKSLKQYKHFNFYKTKRG